MHSFPLTSKYAYFITTQMFPLGVHCLSEFRNLGHNYEQKEPILVSTLPQTGATWLPIAAYCVEQATNGLSVVGSPSEV